MTQHMPVLREKAKSFIAARAGFRGLCLRGGLVLLMAATLGACSPVTATRGNLVENDRLSKIKVGDSDKDEVTRILGTPTAIATFDKNSWYYIGQKTEQYSFLDPEVTASRVIAVHFDDQDKVAYVEDLPQDQVADIDPVSTTTPAAGREESFVEQMLGNLAHPTIPQMGSGPGQH